MMLIEADGKALFAEQGIAVPPGVVVTDVVPTLPGEGPWMVKAQVPVGGRGKAGGIIRCDTRSEVEAAVAGMLGKRLKGHGIDACLVKPVRQAHLMNTLAATWSKKLTQATREGTSRSQRVQ